MCFSSIFSAQNFYSIDSNLTVAKTRENIVILKQIVVQTQPNVECYVDRSDKPFFANFLEFSKRFLGLKHLYLKQITNYTPKSKLARSLSKYI